MEMERDYYQEINNYLYNYGIRFMDDENQRYRLNYEIEKLEIYIEHQFENFWILLLETIRDNLNTSENNQYFDMHYRSVATLKYITNEGVKNYDVTSTYIHRLTAEMEGKGIIKMIGHDNFFRDWKYRLKRNNQEPYVFKINV